MVDSYYIAAGAPGDKSVSVFRGDNYQHQFTQTDDITNNIVWGFNVSGATDGNYNNVATTNDTNQYGSGLTLNITVSGGTVKVLLLIQLSGYEGFGNVIVAVET